MAEFRNFRLTSKFPVVVCGDGHLWPYGLGISRWSAAMCICSMPDGKMRSLEAKEGFGVSSHSSPSGLPTQLRQGMYMYLPAFLRQLAFLPPSPKPMIGRIGIPTPNPATVRPSSPSSGTRRYCRRYCRYRHSVVAVAAVVSSSHTRPRDKVPTSPPRDSLAGSHINLQESRVQTPCSLTGIFHS